MAIVRLCDACRREVGLPTNRVSVECGLRLGAGQHYDLCIACWNKAAAMLGLQTQEVKP